MANKKYTREQLINILKDYYNDFNEVPSFKKLKKYNYIKSSTPYYDTFGNFKQALEEANISYDNSKFNINNTKEYWLNIFKEEVNDNLIKTGKLLTQEDFKKYEHKISASTISRKLGGLKRAYELININQEEFNKKYLENDMIKKFIEISNILNKTPSSRDLDRFSKSDSKYYSAKAYSFHFGGMTKIQQICNLRPTRLGWNMDKKEMLDLLFKLYEELKTTPTCDDIDCCDYTPCNCSYCCKFGSLKNALLEANIPTNKELITPNGNKALSGYEYKFMLVLEKYNINFKKEEFYKNYIENFNKNYRFDFTINNNGKVFFVEIFGITGNKYYDKKTKEKIKICKKNNLTLIEFYPNEIGFNSFEEIFKLLNEKLNEKGIDELDGTN